MYWIDNTSPTAGAIWLTACMSSAGSFNAPGRSVVSATMTGCLERRLAGILTGRMEEGSQERDILNHHSGTLLLPGRGEGRRKRHVQSVEHKASLATGLASRVFPGCVRKLTEKGSVRNSRSRAIIQ